MSGQPLLDRYREKTADARFLLDWAISDRHVGTTDGDPKTVPKSVFQAVADAEVKCHALAGDSQAPAITETNLTTLDEAVQTLSRLTAPVTVETLRDSSPSNGRMSWTQVSFGSWSGWRS